MKKLQKAYSEAGFEILGVAVDEKAKLAGYFKTKGGLPWPSVLDPKGDIYYRLKIKALPTYFLIDREGRHVATPWGKEALGQAIAETLGVDPVKLD